MAHNYWTCEGCGYRNLKIHTNCRGEGCNRHKRVRGPRHRAALRLNFETYAELNRQVHGVDDQTCAICGRQQPGTTRHNRDHAHFTAETAHLDSRYREGFPRGLLCARCNQKLGEVERGTDGELWLESALKYCIDARLWYEANRDEAA